MGRQRHELLATAEEERIGSDEEAGLISGKGCESGVDLGFGGSLQELFPLPLDRNDRSPPRVGSRSLRSYLRGGLSLASIGPAGQQRDAAGAIDLHEIARSRSSIRKHGACAEKPAPRRVFWTGLKLDSNYRVCCVSV